MKLKHDNKATCESCGATAECGGEVPMCAPCSDQYQLKSALGAGIPLSVIEGRTKLTDHFTREYIDAMKGTTNET